MSDLIEVPTGRLFAHPLQPRTGLGAETVASAREAIALEGGRYPKSMAITVRQRAEGGYEILAGHHRAEAARQAKAPTVWAFVSPMSDAEAAMFLASSNSHTEMSPFEHGRHALLLAHDFGVTHVEYARRMGRTPAWVSLVVQAYQVLEAHGGIDHPYSDLPYTALAATARLKDHDQREEVLTELMGHRNPASIAGKLCTAVVGGERPSVALRRIEKDRKPAPYRETHLVDVNESSHGRPDLAARAEYTQWLASWVEGMAFALSVREEELARRRPDLSDPKQKRAFDDAVEARVRREWPHERDGIAAKEGAVA